MDVDVFVRWSNKRILLPKHRERVVGSSPDRVTPKSIIKTVQTASLHGTHAV